MTMKPILAGATTWLERVLPLIPSMISLSELPPMSKVSTPIQKLGMPEQESSVFKEAPSKVESNIDPDLSRMSQETNPLIQKKQSTAKKRSTKILNREPIDQGEEFYKELKVKIRRIWIERVQKQERN